jgi:MFS family permease
MSYIAAIPWVSGFAGYVMGGIVADVVYRKIPDGLTARKITTIAPLTLAAIALFALNLSSETTTAVILLALIMMLMTASVQSCWATLHELVPESRMGGVGGFVHLISNVSGIIGPALTGFVVQHFGGYGGAFAIAGTIAAVGAIAMVLFIKHTDKIEARTDSRRASI